MNSITLETIKAEQGKLAAMISALEAQANQATQIHFPEAVINLQPGEEFAGLILGKDGDASYHLILLPGQATDISWEDAKAWAKGQGGELPNRRDQSLLFANLKEHFEGHGYWSSEQYESDSSYAWCQYFLYGSQYDYHKSAELRARAVRRLILE